MSMDIRSLVTLTSSECFNCDWKLLSKFTDHAQFIYLVFYLLSDLSKTGFHQKAQGLYKVSSQVTKIDLGMAMTIHDVLMEI